MSDEDRDIDVESDDDDDDRTASSLLQSRSTEYMTQAEKRAHHNALERKRRDHIKDSFHNLRDAVPSLQGEKASRAHILKSATEYIQYMTKKNSAVHSNIEDLKKENRSLETQVRALDRAKAAGIYAQSSQPVGIEDALGSLDQADDSPAEDEDHVIDADYHIGSTRKKLKT